jgi:transposase InsO family protein
VSQSGFYEARRHAEKTAIRKACVHVRATFTASGQSYGNRRLVAALASQGITVGRYKVRCLMWQERRKPVWKRKFVHTTDSRHDFPVAPNVLSGSSTRPRQTWLTPPISRIRTGTGWLYLAVVLDLFSRKVVGWAMVPAMLAMLAKLVCDALHMAIQQRCAPPGLNVRSDRGNQ